MQEKVIQVEPPLIDRVNSEKENLKDQLLAHLSQDSVRILQEQELLDWDLLKSLEFKDFSDLGMNMSTFLKLRNLLNGNYSILNSFSQISWEIRDNGSAFRN